MSLILVVGALTLLTSFLCSLFEAALYAITTSQIELLKSEGVAGAERLEALRKDPEEPIAAILTINTIAHTVGSAWLGAMVAGQYGGEYPNAVAIFAAIFTFLVLALTEIVPKSIGVRYAKTLGPMVAMPIQWMVWISYPIAKPSKAIMRWLTGGAGEEGPTEDEVVLFSRLARGAGGVREEEHRWVRGALRLDRATAGDLRTPRTVVFSLDADATVADATADPSRWKNTRVPVTDGGELDKAIGLVHRREVFGAAIEGRKDETLRDLMHPLPFVPETMRAHELLNKFLDERRHMVAVADEYGGFEGVVTLEDVLEEMLGSEIVDEADEFVDMQEAAREQAARPEE
ncbi:MAG: hemolysin family protein [Planctomycetota bacterium]